ncbi:hypothetical protein [Gracilibacillus dipsosauri]|uniref:hypothetical protein n=1 Tax=Gracilibacillus dipsosauri TaxID=178340 RepID=UPI002409603A
MLMRLIFILLAVFAAFLNLLGLLRFIPMYITIPLLFVSIYLAVYFYNDRKQFKGFHS